MSKESRGFHRNPNFDFLTAFIDYSAKDMLHCIWQRCGGQEKGRFLLAAVSTKNVVCETAHINWLGG